jgi:hypothetical protein
MKRPIITLFAMLLFCTISFSQDDYSDPEMVKLRKQVKKATSELLKTLNTDAKLTVIDFGLNSSTNSKYMVDFIKSGVSEFTNRYPGKVKYIERDRDKMNEILEQINLQNSPLYKQGDDNIFKANGITHIITGDIFTVKEANIERKLFFLEIINWEGEILGIVSNREEFGSLNVDAYDVKYHKLFNHAEFETLVKAKSPMNIGLLIKDEWESSNKIDLRLLKYVYTETLYKKIISSKNRQIKLVSTQGVDAIVEQTVVSRQLNAKDQELIQLTKLNYVVQITAKEFFKTISMTNILTMQNIYQGDEDNPSPPISINRIRKGKRPYLIGFTGGVNCLPSVLKIDENTLEEKFDINSSLINHFGVILTRGKKTTPPYKGKCRYWGFEYAYTGSEFKLGNTYMNDYLKGGILTYGGYAKKVNLYIQSTLLVGKAFYIEEEKEDNLYLGGLSLGLDFGRGRIKFGLHGGVLTDLLHIETTDIIPNAGINLKLFL